MCFLVILINSGHLCNDVIAISQACATLTSMLQLKNWLKDKLRIPEPEDRYD